MKKYMLLALITVGLISESASAGLGDFLKKMQDTFLGTRKKAIATVSSLTFCLGGGTGYLLKDMKDKRDLKLKNNQSQQQQNQKPQPQTVTNNPKSSN